MEDKLELRYAHSVGICDLKYLEDGSKIITGGADGDVRIYDDFEDTSPNDFLVGDACTCLTAHKDVIYAAASSSNTVNAYDLNEGTERGLVARFTADASALDISRDGKLLVAGSEDMTLKLIDVEKFQESLFSGHRAPILAVNFDPKAEVFASSSCDGSIRVWSVADKNEVGKFEAVWNKSNDVQTSKTPGRIAWNPDGSLLAAPAEKAVKIYCRKSWSKKTEFTAGEKEPLGEKDFFTVVAFSPDGKYLSAGTSTGELFIWSMDDKEIVLRRNTSTRGYKIARLAWNPVKSDELAFICHEGYWSVIEHALGRGEKKEPNEEEEDLMDADELAKLFNDDQDEADENSVSIRQLKMETTGLFSDGDSDPENEDGKKNSAASSKNPTPVPPVTAQAEQQVVYRGVDPQDPFQPGSTSMRLSSRFMVWNSIGVVSSLRTEEEHSISVEFHDSAVHHNIHISNVHSFSMADLSSECMVLASTEDANSRLTCRQFNAGGDEWSVTMKDESENIDAVACGSDWCAAATDKRRLRLFTLGGFQRDILTLPGMIVCMAGFKHHLFVVIHGGSAAGEKDQNLSFGIFNVWGKKHPSPDFRPLPISAESELYWIGFSDEGTPAAADNQGVLRVLNSQFGGSCWMEVCDTRTLVKGKSDHHFIVGLNERENTVRSILCKGSRYPHTVPRPSVSVLSMVLPLCDAITEKGLLEEQLLKQCMVGRALLKLGSSEEDDEERETNCREQNETLVKLFALACKVNQDSRAMDICKLMDTATIQIAIKYASKMRKMQLAQKLNQLACEIQEEEDQEQQQRSEQHDKEVESNVDMFEEDAENPILAAKMKKADFNHKPRSILGDTQSQLDTRNPFKKSAAKTSQRSSNPDGIVFDEVTLKPPSNAGKNRNSQFSSKAEKSVQKENNVAKIAAAPIKGFQLWMAENKESLKLNAGLDDAELNEKGLEEWKKLAKDEKEKYKVARVPLKRKNVNDLNEQKRQKLCN